jgi:hypothetical protein
MTLEAQFKNSRHDAWPQVDRRTSAGDDPDPVVAKLEKYLNDRLTENSKENKAYFDDRFDEVIKLIKDGFPGGDPRGHREVHEGYIAEAKTKKEWRDAIIKQVLTGSVWATLLFLGGAIWLFIKNEVKK